MFLPVSYLVLCKAVGDLLIYKMKINLLPGITRVLSGIMVQKMEYKNMFLPGSYLRICKAVRVL